MPREYFDYGVLEHQRQDDGRAHAISGTDEMGKQRLLYSLRQLEYLQYYIHQMRLTDPAWVMSFTNHDHSKGVDNSGVLPLVDNGNKDRVPLPNNIMRADFFTKLVSSAYIPNS